MILLNVKLLLKGYFLKYGFVEWSEGCGGSSEGIEPSTRTFFSYLNLPSPAGVLPLAQAKTLLHFLRSLLSGYIEKKRYLHAPTYDQRI